MSREKKDLDGRFWTSKETSGYFKGFQRSKAQVLIITNSLSLSLSLSIHKYMHKVFFLSFSWPSHKACRILVSQLGMEPTHLAVKAWGPNHWTAREFPLCFKEEKKSSFSLIQICRQPWLLSVTLVMILSMHCVTHIQSDMRQESLSTAACWAIIWATPVPVWAAPREGDSSDGWRAGAGGVPPPAPSDPMGSKQCDCHLEKKGKCVSWRRVEKRDTASAP